jgi:hypothetical protein
MNGDSYAGAIWQMSRAGNLGHITFIHPMLVTHHTHVVKETLGENAKQAVLPQTWVL